MRKMASIQKIREILPHNNADALEIVMVNDWQVVVKKGEFSKDQLVIYFEIDSWIPHEIAAFLSKGKEPREYEGVKGERLRTVKLRGEISQGLVLPTEVGIGGFLYVKSKNGIEVIQEGDDVSEILNVKKWEPTIPACLRGRVKGNFPIEIPKTDQERIQNLSKHFDRIKEKRYEVTEKLHGCFKKKQYIETWDSGTVTIGQIVDDGIRPKLIGVDKDGKLVPVEITNVFNNGFKEHWLRISFDPLEKANIVGKGGKLECTINHKIFKSDMTEIVASELEVGDELLMASVELNDAGIHYINSSMLGDGHIGGNGHYSYNESHATKYHEYLKYIKNIFSKVKMSSRTQISGYGSEIEHIKVFKTHKIKELRKDWYGTDGIKLPKNIDWIDDFSIAKWYMDDGSLAHNGIQNDRACFATNAFSENDVDRLCKKLHSMYNVDAVAFKTDKGFRIRVNYSKGTIHNLWKAIAPHVIPEQRYKLPLEYRDYPLIHYPEVSYERIKLPVKVTKIEFESLSSKSSGFIGYDLETTTHNYFCGGVLVHNSSCTFYLDNDDKFHVCSRNLDLDYEENNAYWKAAILYNVGSMMKSYNMQGHAIQGELIGEGINGNQYGIKGVDFFVFDIYNANKKRYLSPYERYDSVRDLKLKHVPVLDADAVIICDSIQELLKLVEGRKSYLNNSNMEGYVFKTKAEVSDGRDVESFKVISNTWLLKNE